MYRKQLASEWIDWVESPNPQGGREKEIYPLIKAWLKQVKPKILVDVGCGQGICSELVSRKTKYIGVDPSKKLISRARNLYKSSNSTFIIGNASEIPVEDTSTDALMSIWVWSHLQELDSTAKEMFRALKPGGKYLIVTANPATYETRKTFYSTYKEYDGYLVGNFALGGGKHLTNTSLYFHTQDYMEKSLTNAGLVIDSIETNGFKDKYPVGLNIVIKGSK